MSRSVPITLPHIFEDVPKRSHHPPPYLRGCPEAVSFIKLPRPYSPLPAVLSKHEVHRLLNPIRKPVDPAANSPPVRPSFGRAAPPPAELRASAKDVVEDA